jgi:hypothetical protein
MYNVYINQDLDMVCSCARTWMEGVAGERSTLWATMHSIILKSLALTEGFLNKEGDIYQTWVDCGGSTMVDAVDGTLIESQPVVMKVQTGE